MKLIELSEIFKKNNIVAQLQTTGGFAIKSLDDTTLSYIQVENVYDRLGYLSENNIVAVSECVKGDITKDNVVYKMLSKPNFTDVKLYGCDTDTGFVINSTDKSVIAKEILGGSDNKTVTSVLNFDGIKIASIHLPGDGPKNQTIHAFLDENLKNLKHENVDVVCGDTNITDAKALNKIKGRNEDIIEYFKNFFGGPCLVLTSNVRVGKHRRGFLIRNQQLKKSMPESANDTEADGTIIAIKLKYPLDKIDVAILHQLKVLNHSESQSVENALEFKVPPSRCLDKEGNPIEKIWLDHSVLFINMSIFCYLIGKEYKSNYPRNLIVINMGSIVNAGFKSWNTKYLPYQREINIADRDIYKIVCKYNPKTIFPSYDDIFGSSMLSSVDKSLISTYGKGVDNIIIYVPSKEMMEEIDKIISKLMLLLTHSAGNLKKSKKNRLIKRNSRRRLSITKKKTYYTN
jgi:hypothetical protein